MKPHLKPLRDQVIVITGASSGIGLVTARLAAHEGAKVVLCSRNQEALRRITDELRAAGARAAYAVADVSREDDLRRLADTAEREFGRIDTWVNNAGVSIYGRLEEVSHDDHRRLFDTNYWGVVHGSRVAVERLRRHGGGALINIGSVLGERSIPLQGAYCASKHAVKGFTEALRMELEEEGAPVWVTLIKPSAIDTPYREHARNYLPNQPQNPPPVYAPETVAHVILFCAEHPRRDVTVGGGGRAITAIGKAAPRLLDKMMEQTMFGAQKTNRPRRDGAHALYGPGEDGRERGGYQGHVAESSAYTALALHPAMAAAVVLGAGMLAAALWATLRRPTSPTQPAPLAPAARPEPAYVEEW